MSTASDAILFTTLTLVCLSFLCSIYTTLRILLPLISHPLSRRNTGPAVGPYPAPPNPTPKALNLKSAQRFTVWMAVTDITAAIVLIWEAALASHSGFGSTSGGASRLYAAVSARSTLLLVVAVLSYANVVRGNSISLGAMDWIVWLPAFAILAVSSGLVLLFPPSSSGLWGMLIGWQTIVTTVIIMCFGRLLYAILRVRKWTMAANRARLAHEQSRITEYLSAVSLPRPSNASSAFVSYTNEAPNRSTDLHVNGPEVCSSPRSGLRPSFESIRDFRSPTPGSARHLLFSPQDEMESVNVPDSPVATSDFHYFPDRISQDELARKTVSFDQPRPSTSSDSGFSCVNAAGFIGSTQTRKAIMDEVAGRAPQISLSRREGRGAVVRIGGHLAGSLIGYALASPYLFQRLLSPTRPPPTSTSILLIIAITQPALVLAIQSAMSEGFWYRPHRFPKLTSSSANFFEKDIDTEKGPREGDMARHPRGIPLDVVDVDNRPKTPLGRAISMISLHPKLQVLSDPQATSTAYSSRQESSPIKTHVRLRSMNMSRSHPLEFTEIEKDLGSMSMYSDHHSIVDFSMDDSALALPNRAHSMTPTPGDVTIDMLTAGILNAISPSSKSCSTNSKKHTVLNMLTQEDVSLVTNPERVSRRNRNTKNLSLGNTFSSNLDNFKSRPFPQGRKSSLAAEDCLSQRPSSRNSDIHLFERVVRNSFSSERSRKPSIDSRHPSQEREGVLEGYTHPNFPSCSTPQQISEESEADEEINRRRRSSKSRRRRHGRRHVAFENHAMDSAVQVDAQDTADESTEYERAQDSLAAPPGTPCASFWDPHSLSEEIQPSFFVGEDAMVLDGYQDEADETEEVEIKCATVRPVSRAETMVFSPTASVYSLRSGAVTETHLLDGKRIHSRSSITSQGFKNMMESNLWHGNSSGDENSAAESHYVFSKPVSRTPLRNLTLLGERDPNVTAGESDLTASDFDGKYENKARPARPPSIQCMQSVKANRQPSAMAVTSSPRPKQIEETDEDFTNSTRRFSTIAASFPTVPPLNMSKRTKSLDEVRQSMQCYLPDLGGPNKEDRNRNSVSTRPHKPAQPSSVLRSIR